jgi:predicted AlkP superfamily phosphohydrolase/phosphomutase
MSLQPGRISRRCFLQVSSASALASLLASYGCTASSSLGGGKGARGKRVVVLGVDGFDPVLGERLMNAGRLPNLQRLREAGGYRRLGTTIPPQSPVAWASFITGANPGVHGIFDFIHRDPAQQCMPRFSAAETIPATDGWEVGDYRIPLTFWPFSHSPAQTVLRREGIPFWDYLDAAGVPAWIYDIPSNYPPSPSQHGHQFCLSGMGTPDLLGTYGTYQHFSSQYRQERHEGGGIRKPLIFRDHAAKAVLTGPKNTLLTEAKQKDTELEFMIYRDPTNPVARLDLPDTTVLLNVGEWSDWVRARFCVSMPSFMPDSEVTGICRFYLQEVRPVFRLYVSAIHIDPSSPGEQRITTPPEFAKRIAQELNLFGTLGFQEDHKALSNRIFTDTEFQAQAEFVLEERLKLLDYALNHYDDGLLFFYFSSTDLQAHMLWWDSAQKHPVRSADEARHGFELIEQLYQRMDEIVGDVAKRVGPQATLLVMSDHGFCNFRRQLNLNTWLRENDYLGPASADNLLGSSGARVVDWGQTRAYGMGLNGLYLNVRGREQHGVVDAGTERENLLRELKGKLLSVRDPENGEPAISAVYLANEVYDGPCQQWAPDLIVGYRRGYRSSWATTLGGLSEEVFSDNDSAWSADHCMATEELPGVLFANRPITHPTPSLIDLAPTVLNEFALTAPPQMTGRSVFQVGPVTRMTRT